MATMKTILATVASVCVLGLFGSPVACGADKPPTAAMNLQDAFTNVAEKAFPAVVVITNKRIEQRPLYPELPPQFRHFFGVPQQGPRHQQEAPQARKLPRPVGKGSGVIIRADGYIVTNYHVIKQHDALEVKLSNGQIFDSAVDKDAVRVVGTDEESDLAVLQIGGGKLKALPTLPFADSVEVKVGQWAIAVGAPFNLDYSVTVGVVSQKGRHDVGMTTFENYIQTDASINPGNSGGPLLNIHGEVIGINEFIVTGGGMSRGSIGLGFAIDSNLAKQVTDDLVEHGDVSRPFLGIGMQPLTDELKKQFDVQAGVLVSEVMEGDPADKAGIKAGDVIVAIGDKPVRTPHDLLFAVLTYQPGDKIKVVVNREGKTKEYRVIARRRDGKAELSSTIEGRDDLLNKLGLALEENKGNIVSSGVVGGSPADAAKLQRGDRIFEVNRQEVKTVGEAIKALTKTKDSTAVFYVGRRGRKFFVPLQLSAE